MNSGVNDVRQATCADRSDGAPGTEPGVELTPRGLELLEALNDLFDTPAAGEDRPEAGRFGHGGRR